MTFVLPKLGAELDECLQSHPLCTVSPSNRRPTRLLELSLCDEILHARLIPGISCRASYVALSYCWGLSLPAAEFRTTNSSLAAHEHSINVGRLPGTIRDVLSLTWALGYRYIWIDSLCIVQDSAEDWKKEAPQRGEVFSNALCTILAPTADARETFLMNGTSHDVSGEVLGIHASNPSNALFSQQLGSQQPTSSRAWCLQEIEQSSRVIFFLKSKNGEMFPKFLCRTSFLTRSGLQVRPSSTPCNTEHLASPDFYTYWYEVVQEYSRRQLTRESDKLLALATLVTSLQKIQYDTYAFGLWSGDLVRGLLWRSANGDDCHRPKQYIAASWSWASVVGEVQYPHLKWPLKQDLVSVPTLIDMNVDRTNGPTLSNTIIVRGKVKHAICTKSHAKSENNAWQLIDAKNRLNIGHVFLDTADKLPEEASVFCICLANFCKAEVCEDHVVAIALRHMEGELKTKQFSRIGYAELQIAAILDESTESLIEMV